MAKRRSAKWLAKAVLTGEWTFDTAIEEHLHENYRGPLEPLPYSKVNLVLCFAVMDWRDRAITVWGEPFTVDEIIEEFDLEPFLPIFDCQDNASIRRGDLVTYEDEVYRVIGRRAVNPFAGRRCDNFEVFIEPIHDDGTSGFVGEDSVEPVENVIGHLILSLPESASQRS